MGRAPCCDKVGLKKGPWTPEEDQKLVSYIQEHGHGSWRALPQNAGLLRCGKSCRLRWTNYLRPDIKRGNFSVQEEQTIIQLHALLGNRWSTIAQHLPKRTDNEIKNYWNTHLKKRLSKMGIDPVTHKPKSDSMNVLDGHSRSSSALSHMAQWESARMEAEVRLARQSRLRNKGLFTNHVNPSSSHANLFQNNDTWKKEPLSLHVTTRSRCLDVLNAKLLSSAATNTNSCLTASTNSTHLMESPTSSLTFVDGAYNRQSSDTSGDTNTNYLSMLQKKPESSPFQIPIASSPLENKPSREDLSRFLLGTDNHGDQSSNPAAEHSLLFPSLHDMMLFPSDHHCSSTPSVSSPEEQSPANQGDDTTNFESCFNEDLLLDLDEAPNCDLAEEEEPHKQRDYWNNILNMVNSPGGHNSSVPSIF